jgi:hypothetical protein
MENISPLPHSKLISIGLKKPNCMPPSLWIEGDEDSPYRRGFRTISSFDDYPETKIILHMISHSEKIKKLGRKVWVCLDSGNGDPTFFFAKIYVWVFLNKKDALKQYFMHKSDPKLTQLYYPKKYLIIDQLKLTPKKQCDE